MTRNANTQAFAYLKHFSIGMLTASLIVTAISVPVLHDRMAW